MFSVLIAIDRYGCLLWLSLYELLNRSLFETPVCKAQAFLKETAKNIFLLYLCRFPRANIRPKP